ncbi:MAG TPA: redoxin family protein, partial [Gemmataceae bacterium]
MRLCKALWVVIGLAVPATAGCGDAVGVREGARAPAFALPAEDGSVVRSDALQGQPVLVTFWSTTCGPCVKEI